MRRGKSKILLFVGLLIVLVSFAYAQVIIDPNGPDSDDFNSCTLDNIWTFVNPVGDGTYYTNGTNLLITVPQGTDHDVWTAGDRAARIMQNINNSDFEIETKFESTLTSKYQLQGMIVEENVNNYVRTDYYTDGSTIRLFVATFTNNIPTTRYNAPVNENYIKINRTGNNWKIYTSNDGNSWTLRTTFNHTITTTRAGVFAGNAGLNPAHTASIDYFFNNQNRINPEDAQTNTRTLTTNIIGQGIINKNPDKAAYGCNEPVTLTALPSQGYTFSEWTGTITGNDNPTNIIMDSDKILTATFIENNQTINTSIIIRINAGGQQYIDTQGNTWQADNYYNTGYIASKINPIDNTIDDTLYQSERWDSATLPEMEYKIPVTNGDYQVNLHFAEVVFNNNNRAFNVNIEDINVLNNFDIYAQAGFNTAIIKSFNTTVNDGELKISFQHIPDKNNPKISAIEIYQISTSNNQTIPINITCNANPTSGITPLNVTFTTTVTGGSGIYTNYAWIFNDTTLQNTNNGNTNHNYNTAGTYTPTVIVTDNQNNTATTTCPTITATENIPVNNTLLNLTSDDFNYCTINPIWEFVNPVGDGTYSVDGTRLLITVPQGTDHDVWTAGDKAARMMQNISNADFEIETKFESILTSKYQLQGIIIEQDTTNYIRTDYYTDGSTIRLFVATFTNNIPTVKYNAPLNENYIKINRTGNNWKIYSSNDGITWILKTTFDYTIITTKAGVFAGNAGLNPTHTTIIDYFFNNQNRITPEDAQITTKTLTTNIIGQGIINKNPDKASYGCNEPVTLAAIPASGYKFSEWSGDISGNTSITNIVMDYDKNITATFQQKATTTIRINAGGPQYVDSNGKIWLADNYYNTGNPSSTTSTIANTTEDTLYQTNRWDSATLPEMEYKIPVTNGVYQVNLHFAEVWSGAFNNNIRVFNVSIENINVLNNFDIYAQAGANTALVKSFNTTVNDSELKISFQHIPNKNNPMITAIEIIGLSTFNTTPVIYREYSRVMTGNFEWRVNDPNATYVGDPDNTPAYYLPNRILNISLDDLDGAVRAEAIIDLWGGHPGTTNKSMRFNNNTWINITELSNTPGLGQCYMSERTVTVPIPLENLQQGMNYFEGTSGGQSDCYNFNWGQWGWYGMVIRIYYNESKPHTFGSISSHNDGDSLTENPLLQVDTIGPVQKVDFIGYYDGYDTAGNGVYTKYHYDYQMKSFAGIIEMNNYIGSTNNSPYKIVWNTTFIPDQPINSVKIKARILDNNGIWYETDEVKDLSLLRNQNVSVKLYKPLNVPQVFWIRTGQAKFSNINIPVTDNLSDAIAAKLLIRTWNGLDTGILPNQTHYTKVNNWQTPEYGKSYFYSYDQVMMPVIYLKQNMSNITFYSQTTEHGIEVMWPGPALVVRYDKGAPKPNYNSTPDINVWYGEDQSFGQVGNAQKWINIQGNVSDDNGITNIYYSLNNGLNKTLSLGPDLRRLSSTGDFNIDINRSILLNGINNVTITAVNTIGNKTIKNIKINYTSNNIWPQPYTIDWSNVSKIQDVAEVVDGLWVIQNNNVKPIVYNYDRLLAIGDIQWTDYEITVPITVHSIDNTAFNLWTSGNGVGVGFLMRWQGHTDNPIINWQPKTGWRPFGAIGWYWWTSPTSARLQLHRETILSNGTVSATDVQTTSTIPPSFDVTYYYKMRVTTDINNLSTYSLKVWPINETEPIDWTLTSQEDTAGLRNGSVILLAHHINASFGNVQITPIIQNTAVLLSVQKISSSNILVQNIAQDSTVKPMIETVDYVVPKLDYTFHSTPTNIN